MLIIKCKCGNPIHFGHTQIKFDRFVGNMDYQCHACGVVIPHNLIFVISKLQEQLPEHEGYSVYMLPEETETIYKAKI